MAFKYYPEYQAPQVQQGEIVNYAWVPIGTTVYQTKVEAEQAALTSSYHSLYDMRIIKSFWEIAQTIPKA